MKDLENQEMNQEKEEAVSVENENTTEAGSDAESEKYGKYGYSKVRKKTEAKRRRQMCC